MRRIHPFHIWSNWERHIIRLYVRWTVMVMSGVSESAANGASVREGAPDSSILFTAETPALSSSPGEYRIKKGERKPLLAIFFYGLEFNNTHHRINGTVISQEMRTA